MVECGALASESDRVAKRENDRVRSKFQSPRGPGDNRQQGHRFRREVSRHDLIRLPDRIDRRVLAQVEPCSKSIHGFKGEATQTDSDAD
jgi:hypothetical protein